MSALEQRGGFPVVFSGAVATTGVVTDDRTGVYTAGDPLILGAHQVQDELEGRAGPIITKYMEIRNLDGTAGNAVRVYFRQDHYDDNVHFITLPGGGTQLSVWHGPAEAKLLWLRAAAGTPRFEVIAYHRRG